MINTYNESHLHKTLKTLYAEQFNGQTEVELHGHIYDIVADIKPKSKSKLKTQKTDSTNITTSTKNTEKLIIEIQTKNLSKLLAKIMDTLEKGHRVILVYPLVIRKWISLYDKDGKLLSNRKSPKINSIYDLFDELTGLYPILLHKNFRLDVVFINMTETRLKTDDPVQSKNGRRRFKKNWIKSGKELKEIIETKTFKTADDYLSLLPDTLPPEFSAKDLSLALKKDKTLPASAAKNAHLILWVLVRMELVLETEVRNRKRYFKINPKYIRPELYGTFTSI